MSGLNAAAQDAVIAQSIEWYYWNTAFASASKKQFFKLDAAAGLLQYSSAKGEEFSGAKDKANSYLKPWLDAIIGQGAYQSGGGNGSTVAYTQYQQWNVVATTSNASAAALLADKSQIFVGNTGADTFTGGDKADLLIGNTGNDTLTGGAGNDVLIGGDGQDTYTVGSGKDTVRDNTQGEGSIRLAGGITLTGGKGAGKANTWVGAQGEISWFKVILGDETAAANETYWFAAA